MADIQVTAQDILAAQVTDSDSLAVAPNRAQLDLPLADVATQTQSEVADAPTEAPTDAPVEDTEDDELSKLLDDEQVDTEDSDEEKPTEEDGDFAKRFDDHFAERFGMSPDEAVELVTELVAERKEREVRAQLTELQTAWGIDEPAMRERLELVADYWTKLSPEKQAKFNSVKGALTIYAKLEQMGKTPKKLQSSVSKAPAGQPKHMYTQKQIDEMPIAQYQAEADRIAYAIANGLVRR